MAFAGIAFVWFIVALRTWISGISRGEDILLSNIQLVSGILFVGLFLAGGSAAAASEASAEFLAAPFRQMRLSPPCGSTSFAPG
jgi:hypothetical protein